MGPRDQLERQDLLVKEDTLGPLVHLESRVFLAQLAKREQRETPDHKEPLVRMALLACEASLENEVYLEPRVHQV